MMNFRRTLLAVALASALPFSVASADPITFSPSGGGTSASDLFSFSSLQWVVNSAVGVNSVTAIGNGAGSGFTLLAQASLSNFLNSSGGVVGGTGVNSTYELTYVVRYNETVATTSGGNTATFSSTSATPNFIELWIGSIDSDPLTGFGYNDGTLILSATIDAATENSNFTVSSTTPVSFDQFPTNTSGDNNYPGVSSITGTGSANLTGTVTSYNGNYFISAPSLISLFLSNNLKAPFTETNPSICFTQTAGGTAQCDNTFANLDSGNGGYNPDLGTFNGAGPQFGGGPDFEFQQTGTSSIRTASIPEPGSLALLAGALLAGGFVTRRTVRK